MHLHGITKLEYGEREPSWPTVLALAKALDVTCEAFNGEAAAEAPEQRSPGRPRKAEAEEKAAPKRKGAPRKPRGKGK
jgi:hypothetical protein